MKKFNNWQKKVCIVPKFLLEVPIKNKTCYKSQEGSCIDLTITSRHRLHQFSYAFETGISDLMVYTMLKYIYAKLEPKILRNCSYKDFNKESFL